MIVKYNILFSAIAGIALMSSIASCKPDEEEVPEETPINADLTGEFEGEIRHDSLGFGSVIYSFESAGTSGYTMYFEGTAIGEASVTQSTFTVEPNTNGDFTELSGYINEDETFISFSGTSTDGAGFSFSGNLLEGDRAETHMVINGQDYTHFEGSSGSPNCSNIGFTYSMIPYFTPKGAMGNNVGFDLEFETLPLAGTYNIVDGAPSGMNAEVMLTWEGVQIQASSGSIVVSGSGSESSLSVALDNTVFDVKAYNGDPVTPVTASGDVKCEY